MWCYSDHSSCWRSHSLMSVQYRWIYLFERYWFCSQTTLFLFSHISNFATILPCCICVDICSNWYHTSVRKTTQKMYGLRRGVFIFCSCHLNGIETQKNQPTRNKDNESSQANETSSTSAPLGREKEHYFSKPWSHWVNTWIYAI